MRSWMILLAWAWAGVAWGQSLCSTPPAGYRTFPVDPSKREVCSEESFSLTLPNNVSGAVVHIGYENQSLDALGSLVRTTNPQNLNVRHTSTQDRVVTLLVTGTIDGQPAIGCTTVRVRPLRTPRVTYEGCSGSHVFLFLDDPENLSLGKLDITWETDNQTVTVDPATQPVLRKSFVVGQDNQIFQIKPGAGVQCGRSATIQVNLRGSDSFSTLRTLTTDPIQTNRITLDLTRGDRPAARGDYDLFIRRPNETAYNPEPLTKIQPGSNTVTLPEDGPYCFVAYRNNYCPNNVSNEICQVVLSSAQSISATENRLTWSLPPTDKRVGFPAPLGTEVQTTVLRVLKYPSAKRLNSEDATDITGSSGLQEELVDDQTSCQLQPCYQLVWRTEGQLLNPIPPVAFTALSYSNIVCVDPTKGLGPPLPEVWVSVVSDTEVEVHARAHDPALIQSFAIQDRAEEVLPTQLPWVDTQSKSAEESVCYRVRAVDVCGRVSDWSEPVCTIHLQRLPGDELAWTTPNPFAPGAITNYRVLGSEETRNQSPIDFTPLVSRFFPDLAGFQAFGDFVVEARSNTGRTSLSNRVRIPIRLQVFFPTAFTPNGDAHNEVWGPVGRFARLTSYQIYIFNRLGQIVWESNQPSRGWDGQINGRPAPTGSYTYQVRLQTQEAEETRFGTLHVYR